MEAIRARTYLGTSAAGPISASIIYLNPHPHLLTNPIPILFSILFPVLQLRLRKRRLAHLWIQLPAQHDQLLAD